MRMERILHSMKEALPINFTARNARDIWLGFKKKTRRPIKEVDRVCRYGLVGDLLWVREPFNVFLKPGGTIGDLLNFYDVCNSSRYDISYPARDGIMLVQCQNGQFDIAQCDPVHMPRWASRMTIEITRLTIQNLHDIDEDDVICKSAAPYKEEWELCYGAGSWEANPLVWEIDFKLVKNYE